MHTAASKTFAEIDASNSSVQLCDRLNYFVYRRTFFHRRYFLLRPNLFTWRNFFCFFFFWKLRSHSVANKLYIIWNYVRLQLVWYRRNRGPVHRIFKLFLRREIEFVENNFNFFFFVVVACRFLNDVRRWWPLLIRSVNCRYKKEGLIFFFLNCVKKKFEFNAEMRIGIVSDKWMCEIEKEMDAHVRRQTQVAVSTIWNISSTTENFVNRIMHVWFFFFLLFFWWCMNQIRNSDMKMCVESNPFENHQIELKWSECSRTKCWFAFVRSVLAW